MTDYAQLKKNAEVFVPVGLILPWTTSTIPSGYLLCDGDPVSRTTYAALFDVIGTNYGSGDGSSTFNLPDLRGKQMVFDDTNTTLQSNAGAASASINTNVNYDSFALNTTVNGNTADAFAPLPNHRHLMFVNNPNTSNTGQSELNSSNESVAHHAGLGNNATYEMRAANSGTASLGTTSYTGNGNAPNHSHGTGNIAVNISKSGAINASSNNVSSLLYTSLVLNAIIKF